MRSLTINGTPIGHHGPAPFLCAELGVSARDFDDALRLVLEAANAGFDGIKFQWHREDEADWDNIPAAAKDAIRTKYLGWITKTKMWQLMDAAKNAGLAVGITAFDAKGIRDFEDRFPIDFIKIGSAEANNRFLLDMVRVKAKQLKVPVVISGGFLNPASFLDVVDEYLLNLPVIMLWCDSFYPSKILPTERDLTPLRERGHLVGVSDHYETAAIGTGGPWQFTLGGRIAAEAGACWIERHISTDSTDPDGEVATYPEDMADYVSAAKAATAVQEHAIWWAQHGWYANKDIEAGQVITGGCKIRRPAVGLSANYTIFGNFKAIRNIPKGKPITWDRIEAI